MSKPNILVATLACGEAEFYCCKAMVSQQQEVYADHVIFENLPELEGHQKLFDLWNHKRSEYDLFVKLDADTVLSSRESFAKLWKFFANDPDLTGLQAGLHDYFTNQMIAGLNCFSPAVSFSSPTDSLYCDRSVEVGHQKIFKPQDTSTLYPIAYHCLHPHQKQAFHFGFRRYMKGQTEILSMCLKAYKQYGGKGRFWALCGARDAFFNPMQSVSYRSPEFAQRFAAVHRTLLSGKLTSARLIGELASILKYSLTLRFKKALWRGLRW